MNNDRVAVKGIHRGLERWLRDEVVPSYERYLASPETGVPIDNVLPRIKARAGAKGD
jgi:hypothetical protein